MGGRIDIEADDIAQLVDELGIGGELELLHPMRLQPMGAPDALHRTYGDADLFGHHRSGPMGGLGRWISEGQSHHAFCHFGPQGRHARRPRLVAQQAIDAFLHESLLPAPDADLGGVGLAHDLVGAYAIGGEQHDPGAPNMLLRRIAVADQSLKTAPVGGRNGDGDASTHAADSHTPIHPGIPNGIHSSDFIH